MQVPVVAVLDANILHAIPVCDCLLWIALEGLVRPHWTAELHDEWMRSVLARRPDLSRSALERRRRAMEAAFPDALVAGHQRHIEGLKLPDPNDRHVLAAAAEARASRIVTYNGSDFPQHALDPYGVSAIHPDDLLVHLLRIEPDAVLRAIRQQRAQLRRPPVSADSLLATFRRHALTQFADALEKRSSEI